MDVLTPDDDDATLVRVARQMRDEMRLGNVVYLPLVARLNRDGNSDQPNRAEVRFDGRAPGPQITVRRFRECQR